LPTKREPAEEESDEAGGLKPLPPWCGEDERDTERAGEEEEAGPVRSGVYIVRPSCEVGGFLLDRGDDMSRSPSDATADFWEGFQNESGRSRFRSGG